MLLAGLWESWTLFVPSRCARFHPERSSSWNGRLNPIRSLASATRFSCSAFVAVVLTFFIAGLLFICALSTSITWERTASRRRPAFSLENSCGKRWVKQLQSALELPCARVVGAASPSTALDRRSGGDRSSFRQARRSCSGSSASDSQ